MRATPIAGLSITSEESGRNLRANSHYAHSVDLLRATGSYGGLKGMRRESIAIWISISNRYLERQKSIYLPAVGPIPLKIIAGYSMLNEASVYKILDGVLDQRTIEAGDPGYFLKEQGLIGSV